MKDHSNESAGPMFNPYHLGVIIADSMEGEGWDLAHLARQLNYDIRFLSRVVNGEIGVDENLANALEKIGWSTADHWMRMQASYELAQERLAKSAVAT